MKRLFLIVFCMLFLTETHAQLKTVCDSDSLSVATNADGEKFTSSVTLLKFKSLFNDSVLVYLNNKLILSRFIKPDSTISSTEIDLTVPYVKLPLKSGKNELKIHLYNEKTTIKTQIIPGYRYLYISKHIKKVFFYYRNKEELYY